MPLFKCSCILGGRCNRINEFDDSPEVKGNSNPGIMSGKSEDFHDDSSAENTLLSLYRPSIGSLSLKMMVQKPGILIHRDLILTSHGNVSDIDAALDVEFVLCYIRHSSRRRRSIPPKTVFTRRLEPHRFFLTDAALDLTLIACEPVDVPEIVPLSIHQHLGSMELLEEGHQVHVVGHLERGDMRGILACGIGITSIVSSTCAINTHKNPLVGFRSEPGKDNGLWMSGSAGFDEHGEFAFMVIDPFNSATLSEASFKRPSLLEASSIRRSKSVEAQMLAPQFGVPLYVIQDWMLMHGIRDLDNLPDQRELLYPLLDKSASSATSFIDGHPPIARNDLSLNDRNAISYMILNSGHLILESKPRRNSSPVRSFHSFENPSIDQESLCDKTSRNLNAMLASVQSETLIKEINELPTASDTLNHELPPALDTLKEAVSSDIYHLIHSKSLPPSKGTHEDDHIEQSRPLKWHSRTLPPSYKTSNVENYGERQSLQGSYSSNDLVKDMKCGFAQNGSSINQAPWGLPQDSASGCLESEEGVSHHGRPLKISVSSDQIYDEISLATPKLLCNHNDTINQCDRETNEKSCSSTRGDQNEPETYEAIPQEGQPGIGEEQEDQSDVGASYSMQRDDASAAQRGEEQEGQPNVSERYMQRDDNGAHREEQEAEFVGSSESANMGASFLQRKSDTARQNYHSSTPSPPPSPLHSPLRPDEISKRIQGYGNVSMRNVNASSGRNMKKGNTSAMNAGGATTGSSPLLQGDSMNSFKKNRFLDVGSSLVSGLWIKTSLTKAPHSEDSLP